MSIYEKIPVKSANRLLCGGQIINVSSVSAEGIPDVMTAAWNCPFDSDEVLVVLKNQKSLKNCQFQYYPML